MRAKRELSSLWRLHRLGFLAVLALTALGLGFIGFLQAHFSVVNAIYGTLSLLAFNYTLPPNASNTPVALELGRFLVPAVGALATFTALVAVLEDQWNLVRAGRQREHVVVCGLGRRGMSIVRSIRGGDPPRSVVAVEADRSNPQIKVARELGAIVAIGDATDAELLKAVGAHRADKLIAVLSEDAENAALASSALRLCARDGGSLDAFCHVTDPDLIDDLESKAMEATAEGVQLGWFSLSDQAARLLLSEYADLARRSKDQDAPHLVVIGTDDITRAIVVNAARQWRHLVGKDAEPLRITIAWEGATDWVARFADRHPSAGRAADLQTYEHDLRASAHDDRARGALDDATAVFVCAPTDTQSLEIGFAAMRLLGDGRPIVVRLLLENAGFAELLGGEERAGSLRLFSLIDRACSFEMISEGFYEELARRLHDDVYRHIKDRGSPASRAWDDGLPETFKRATRALADDLDNKLGKMHCKVRPLSDWDSEVMRLDPKEIDELARAEHDRWSRERKSEGWVWGPTRNDDAHPPTHPLIDVPYDDLMPEDQEYDRNFAQELPAVLASMGYEIHRTNESAESQAPRG